jgi:signal transduction histidine kinase
MHRTTFSGILIAALIILLFFVDIYYQSVQSSVSLWETGWFRWRISVAAILLLLAGGYVWTQRLKRTRRKQEEFSKRLIQAKEEEWKRLASILHDSLGQDLLVLKTELTRAKNSPATEVNQRLQRISELLQETIEDVRAISSELYPHQIENLGLKKALEAMIDKVRRPSGINVHLSIADIDGILSKEYAINFYRIIQELVNNMLKHSGAKNMSVEIYKNPLYLEAVVSDDGCGIERTGKKSSQSGFGLQNIEERVRLLGGKIKIDSKRNKGTKVSISIKIL